MAEYDDRQELADHIDDEGGIHHILRRGTTAAALPPDDTELVQAWQTLDAAYEPYRRAVDAAYEPYRRAVDAAYEPYRRAVDAVMALLPEPCGCAHHDAGTRPGGRRG